MVLLLSQWAFWWTMHICFGLPECKMGKYSLSSTLCGQRVTILLDRKIPRSWNNIHTIRRGSNWSRRTAKINGHFCINCRDEQFELRTKKARIAHRGSRFALHDDHTCSPFIKQAVNLSLSLSSQRGPEPTLRLSPWPVSFPCIKFLLLSVGGLYHQ